MGTRWLEKTFNGPSQTTPKQREPIHHMTSLHTFTAPNQARPHAQHSALARLTSDSERLVHSRIACLSLGLARPRRRTRIIHLSGPSCSI